MEMLERRFAVKTWEPLDSMPGITQFYHSIVSDPEYYSSGTFRKNHTHCVFHYTLRGEGETYCGDTVYRVLPGTGFLNVINDPDSGYRYPRGGKGEWEFIVLCLDRGNTRAIVNELIARYGRLYTIPPDDELMRGLIDEYYVNPERTLSSGESNLLFTRLINRLIESKETGSSGVRREFVGKVEAAVSEGLDSYVTVNSLAEKLGISREYLSRRYRACTGSSLKSYIIACQLSQICGLLVNTGLSLDEIAAGMSFSSGSNLAQFFKRYTGMTPCHYKQRRSETPLY